MKLILIFIFFFINVFAVEENEDLKWAGNLEMNGYKLEDYKNFARDWTLITVRYRQDSGEFRFVYANPIAYKALQNKQYNYPDGAVFAKTAYLLSSDPDFTSSLVPNRVNRYQLMVRNKTKHAETDGWGYALFDPNGKTFPGNPKYVSQSCHACHQIVKAKGYVFSEELKKSHEYLIPQGGSKKSSQTPSFTTTEVKNLNPKIAMLLPKNTKTIRTITGSLTHYLFEGTLNEIQPYLAQEALNAKIPAALISSDFKRFSIVYADATAKGSCQTGAAQAAPMIGIVSMSDRSSTGVPYANIGSVSDGIGTRSFCFFHESKSP